MHDSVIQASRKSAVYPHCVMSGTSLPFARLLHWGPLLTIIIILFISFTTVYFNAMLLPPSESLHGLVNMLIFLGKIRPQKKAS